MNAEVPLALPPPVLPDQNIFRSPEELRSMRYTYALLDKLAVAPSRMPAYMRDLARRGGGVTGLGQDMLHSARMPMQRFFRAPVRRGAGVYHTQSSRCVDLGVVLQNVNFHRAKVESDLAWAKKTGDHAAYATALNARWDVDYAEQLARKDLQNARCGVLRGVGAVGSRIDLKNPDVMREVKTLMTLIKPHYAEKGEAWFADMTWRAEDWVAYKSIAELMASSLESSQDEKSTLVAYVDSAGATKLGWPPNGSVGFPSAIGIEAMAQYLVKSQTFPDIATVQATFPALDKYSTAGVPLPPDPGVERPTLAGEPGATAKLPGGKSTQMAMIVGGVAVVGIVAYLVMRKKKR
jgi:hypothetical protein